MADLFVNGISIDDTFYHVKVRFQSLSRAFNIVEGNNAGRALSARTIRDVLGTSYSYTMDVEPDYAHPEDYDDFFEVISEPTDFHVVKMPYGQTELTFDAQIISGEDVYKGYMSGRDVWGGLTVNFVAMQPQRT